MRRFASAADAGQCISFDRASGEDRFQAATIAARAQRSFKIHRYVTEVPRDFGATAHHRAGREKGASDTASEGKEHHMLLSAGRAPALLAHERRLGVIVGCHRNREAQSIGNPTIQPQSFQERELPWQDSDARRACIDNALAAYSGRGEADARRYLLAQFRQQSGETSFE